MNSFEGYPTNSREFTIDQIKDIIFQTRKLTSDWLDEFHSLEDEAANSKYNPRYIYNEDELIEMFFKQ